MIDYYGIDGQPISEDEFVAAMKARDQDEGEWRIGHDTVADVRISTVWLGIDHGYGEGPPLIFETMIFGGDHDQDQWRYSTRAEALAGHHRAVALVRAGVVR